MELASLPPGFRFDRDSRTGKPRRRLRSPHVLRPRGPDAIVRNEAEFSRESKARRDVALERDRRIGRMRGRLLREPSSGRRTKNKWAETDLRGAGSWKLGDLPNKRVQSDERCNAGRRRVLARTQLGDFRRQVVRRSDLELSVEVHTDSLLLRFEAAADRVERAF